MRTFHVVPQNVVVCIFLCGVFGIIAGCPVNSEYWARHRYAGAIVGSQSIVGSKLLNEYVFQFDTYEGPFTESKRRPLFAIVWKARYGGGEVTSGRNNMVISIHGHSIAPSRTKKAVYALRPDYSLQELSLTDEEIDHLFSIARSREEAGARFYSDSIWQRKVQPFLQVVESERKTEHH